ELVLVRWQFIEVEVRLCPLEDAGGEVDRCHGFRSGLGRDDREAAGVRKGVQNPATWRVGRERTANFSHVRKEAGVNSPQQMYFVFETVFDDMDLSRRNLGRQLRVAHAPARRAPRWTHLVNHA